MSCGHNMDQNDLYDDIIDDPVPDHSTNHIPYEQLRSKFDQLDKEQAILKDTLACLKEENKRLSRDQENYQTEKDTLTCEKDTIAKNFNVMLLACRREIKKMSNKVDHLSKELNVKTVVHPAARIVYNSKELDSLSTDKDLKYSKLVELIHCRLPEDNRPPPKDSPSKTDETSLSGVPATRMLDYLARHKGKFELFRKAALDWFSQQSGDGPAEELSREKIDFYKGFWDQLIGPMMEADCRTSDQRRKHTTERRKVPERDGERGKEASLGQWKGDTGGRRADHYRRSDQVASRAQARGKKLKGSVVSSSRASSKDSLERKQQKESRPGQQLKVAVDSAGSSDEWIIKDEVSEPVSSLTVSMGEADKHLLQEKQMVSVNEQPLHTDVSKGVANRRMTAVDSLSRSPSKKHNKGAHSEHPKQAFRTKVPSTKKKDGQSLPPSKVLWKTRDISAGSSNSELGNSSQSPKSKSCAVQKETKPDRVLSKETGKSTSQNVVPLKMSQSWKRTPSNSSHSRRVPSSHHKTSSRHSSNKMLPSDKASPKLKEKQVLEGQKLDSDSQCSEDYPTNDKPKSQRPSRRRYPITNVKRGVQQTPLDNSASESSDSSDNEEYVDPQVTSRHAMKQKLKVSSKHAYAQDNPKTKPKLSDRKPKLSRKAMNSESSESLNEVENQVTAPSKSPRFNGRTTTKDISTVRMKSLDSSCKSANTCEISSPQRKKSSKEVLLHRAQYVQEMKQKDSSGSESRESSVEVRPSNKSKGDSRSRPTAKKKHQSENNSEVSSSDVEDEQYFSKTIPKTRECDISQRVSFKDKRIGKSERPTRNSQGNIDNELKPSGTNDFKDWPSRSRSNSNESRISLVASLVESFNESSSTNSSPDRDSSRDLRRSVRKPNTPPRENCNSKKNYKLSRQKMSPKPNHHSENLKERQRNQLEEYSPIKSSQKDSNKTIPSKSLDKVKRNEKCYPKTFEREHLPNASKVKPVQESPSISKRKRNIESKEVADNEKSCDVTANNTTKKRKLSETNSDSSHDELSALLGLSIGSEDQFLLDDINSPKKSVVDKPSISSRCTSSSQPNPSKKFDDYRRKKYSETIDTSRGRSSRDGCSDHSKRNHKEKRPIAQKDSPKQEIFSTRVNRHSSDVHEKSRSRVLDHYPSDISHLKRHSKSSENKKHRSRSNDGSAEIIHNESVHISHSSQLLSRKGSSRQRKISPAFINDRDSSKYEKTKVREGSVKEKDKSKLIEYSKPKEKRSASGRIGNSEHEKVKHHSKEEYSDSEKSSHVNKRFAHLSARSPHSSERNKSSKNAKNRVYSNENYSDSSRSHHSRKDHSKMETLQISDRDKSPPKRDHIKSKSRRFDKTEQPERNPSPNADLDKPASNSSNNYEKTMQERRPLSPTERASNSSKRSVNINKKDSSLASSKVEISLIKDDNRDSSSKRLQKADLSNEGNENVEDTLTDKRTSSKSKMQSLNSTKKSCEDQYSVDSPLQFSNPEKPSSTPPEDAFKAVVAKTDVDTGADHLDASLSRVYAASMKKNREHRSYMRDHGVVEGVETSIAEQAATKEHYDDLSQQLQSAATVDRPGKKESSAPPNTLFTSRMREKLAREENTSKDQGPLLADTEEGEIVESDEASSPPDVGRSAEEQLPKEIPHLKHHRSKKKHTSSVEEKPPISPIVFPEEASLEKKSRLQRCLRKRHLSRSSSSSSQSSSYDAEIRSFKERVKRHREDIK